MIMIVVEAALFLVAALVAVMGVVEVLRRDAR
jgi:hypothetical protein